MPTQLANDLSPLLILAVVIGVAAAGGLVPFSPIEPMLAALALTRPALIIPAIIAAAVAQMATKWILFVASRRTAAAIPAGKRAVVERVRARLEQRPATRSAMVLVSAITGLPPFYAVTVASGVLQVPVRDYMLAGTIGRALRFAAIAVLFSPATLTSQAPPPPRDTYVLINGMLGGRAAFRRLESELASAGHRVLTVDPYALSVDSADVSLAAMARRVDWVLSVEHVVNARVVGHAHGGGVALRLAATFPGRASALYLLDVGALPDNRTRALSGSTRLAPAIVKLPYGRDLVRRKLVQGLRDNSGSADWLDDDTRAAYTDPVLDHMGRVIAMAQRLAASEEPEPVASLVARLAIPVTVITGDAARATRPAPTEIDALRPLAPRLRIEVLRGVGHFPHEEAPRAVAALLSAPAARMQVAVVQP